MNTTYFFSVAAIIILIFLSILIMRRSRASAAPGVGKTAPDFDLPGQNGQRHRLADYRGQWLVLYFYPRDDTPGCTAEACRFRDEVPRLRELGAVIVGVSLNEVASHKTFVDKYHLPFPLLADSEKKVTAAYGVLGGFGPIRYARRQTFLIDPQGRIARHYARVSPRQHAEEIISDLQAMPADPA
ncbi:peroxiredoxin [Sulfuriflexus sp.]|uniref:peroxiredoxin n=1 Tax=Sulfuriflexus sp. TaxID=2015443 RepID=UPI0028CC4B94|nr:peroxiredoxin [Sulfuriflexus sp.]MDT8404136.1 peroxiredoxin [Sulfuriflexus sp.]